jgi:hypothetical protein
MGVAVEVGRPAKAVNLHGIANDIDPASQKWIFIQELLRQARGGRNDSPAAEGPSLCESMKLVIEPSAPTPEARWTRVLPVRFQVALVAKLDVAYVSERKVALHALHKIKSNPLSQAICKVIERGQDVKHYKQESERPLGRRDPNPFDAVWCGIRELYRAQPLKHPPMAASYRVRACH